MKWLGIRTTVEVRLTPVGQKHPNHFGLYDMSGNVLEWVWDWHGSDTQQFTDSGRGQGPISGSSRVLRGGHWSDADNRVRVSVRGRNDPTFASTTSGFSSLSYPINTGF